MIYQKKSFLRENCTVPGLLVFGYALIETLKYFRFISILQTATIGVILGTLGFLYVIKHKGFNNLNKRIFSFFALYTLMGLFSHVWNGNLDLPELLWPLFFLGLATVILNYRIPVGIARVSFYIFTVAAIEFIVVAGTHIYDIETSESRNYSSAYVLSLFGIYLISRIQDHRNNVPWLETVVAWFVCVISLGRGGIISAFFMVVLFLFYQIKELSRFKFKNRYIFILFFGVLFYIIGFSEHIAHWYSIAENYVSSSMDLFEQRGMDSNERNKIWTQYVDQILTSPFSVVFSPPIAGTSTLDHFSWNLHNSFLMLYARYSTLIFILVIVMLFKGFKYLYSSHDTKLLAFVMIVILLRCFTDVVAFNGVLDVTLYYFMFSPFLKRNKIPNLNAKMISR